MFSFYQSAVLLKTLTHTHTNTHKMRYGSMVIEYGSMVIRYNILWNRDLTCQAMT